jgi:hypothetical protein
MNDWRTQCAVWLDVPLAVDEMDPRTGGRRNRSSVHGLVSVERSGATSGPQLAGKRRERRGRDEVRNCRRMKSPVGSRVGRECPEPAGGDSKTHVAAVPLTIDLAVPPAGTGPAEVTS